MNKIKLKGINKHDKPARIGADVNVWCDEKNRFSIYDHKTTVKVVTSQGVYYLTLNPKTNNFQGECSGHKVHVHLGKITGWIGYWK